MMPEYSGETANTSRCGCQCAVRVVPIPVGCFVESILDIVHKPKHFRLKYQILRKIILTALRVLLEKQAESSGRALDILVYHSNCPSASSISWRDILALETIGCFSGYSARAVALTLKDTPV